MRDFLLDVAPQLIALFSVAIAFITYIESKRHTKHDEFLDLYDRLEAEDKRFRVENEALQSENERLRDELRKKDEHIGSTLKHR